MGRNQTRSGGGVSISERAVTLYPLCADHDKKRSFTGGQNARSALFFLKMQDAIYCCLLFEIVGDIIVSGDVLVNKVHSSIKRLRQDKGMNQEQLAKQLHVTRQAVSNWETGVSHS